MSDPSSDEFDFQLYRYNPSLVAAILFAVFFGLSSVHHTYKLLRTRTWYFIPLTLGVIAEVVGYIARAMSHYDRYALSPFICQSVLIIVAPALFCASIYMILGRMVRLLDAEDKCIISLKWLTKIFVTGDIISFMVQGAGSGVMSGGSLSSMELGEKIVIGGVLFQVFIFGIFLIVTSIFHHRILKSPTLSSERLSLAPLLQNWKTLLYCLYAAGALVMVRSIFRAIEFIMGNSGPLMRHEAWIYGFDAVLMLGCVVLFNWCHPSGVVPGRPRRGALKGALKGEELSSSDEENVRLEERK